jgi:LPXTG-motif cell wall-anchored protein
MLMDILAGVLCGLLMATVFLGVGIYIVVSNRDIYDRLVKFLPQGVSPALVMLFLVIAVPPSWALFGGIAGSLYRWADESSPNAGLGSSNYTFTLAILCFSALVTLILLFIRKRLVWLGLITNIAFAGIFGWLLPMLASWR